MARKYGRISTLYSHRRRRKKKYYENLEESTIRKCMVCKKVVSPDNYLYFRYMCKKCAKFSRSRRDMIRLGRDEIHETFK